MVYVCVARTDRKIAQFEQEREEQKQRQARRSERQAHETQEYLRKQRVGGSTMHCNVKLNIYMLMVASYHKLLMRLIHVSLWLLSG